MVKFSLSLSFQFIRIIQASKIPVHTIHNYVIVITFACIVAYMHNHCLSKGDIEKTPNIDIGKKIPVISIFSIFFAVKLLYLNYV